MSFHSVCVCVWCSLLGETLSWNSIRPQTAQFYNKRISTDPISVTWQNTVYESPEDGFKKRPKRVGATVKYFNVNCSVFLSVYSVIQKDGLNFVSLYFEIRTSNKYDVNYI